MDVFLRSMVIGLAIAAPVGPIGLLCIRRTLSRGRVAGLVSGLGAASADAVYGAIAGFGLTVVANLLVAQRLWLGLVGGAVLVWLGVRTMLEQPAEEAAELDNDRGGLFGMWASTFGLTLTNPATIFAFIGVFSAVGLAENPGYAEALLVVAGVFSGSALWWLMLSLGVGVLRPWLTPGRLRWINIAAGLMLVGFGLWALWGAVT